jgi:hypothetical protein
MLFSRAFMRASSAPTASTTTGPALEGLDAPVRAGDFSTGEALS